MFIKIELTVQFGFVMFVYWIKMERFIFPIYLPHGVIDSAIDSIYKFMYFDTWIELVKFMYVHPMYLSTTFVLVQPMYNVHPMY